MFKVQNNLSPLPVRQIFKFSNGPYDLRNKRIWETTRTQTVLYGTESIRYRGPNTWEMLPQNIKDSGTIEEFKAKIKLWKPTNCTCRLCRTFVPELGFIN